MECTRCVPAAMEDCFSLLPQHLVQEAPCAQDHEHNIQHEKKMSLIQFLSCFGTYNYFSIYLLTVSC